MHRLNGKQGYFLMKVDLAKAYDMMNMSFVRKVFMEISFPDNNIQVIMESISTVNMAVLWKGHQDGNFTALKGLQ